MRTRSHPIEPEELMAYLDGELPPERASHAAGHLSGCSECQALAVDLRGVSERLMTWRVDAPALVAPAGEVRGERKKRRWYLRWPVWAVAATGAVALVISLSGPMAYRKAPLPLTAAIVVAPPPVPLIVHTARLSLVANDFDGARTAIDQIVRRHNGYIAEMTVNAEAQSARTLNASLRTPDARLDPTLSELKSLGRVLHEARTGEEVTSQSTDLDARLANARIAEQRLVELLRRRTDKLSDVLQVQKEISETRGRIAQMEAERKNLDKSIQYAKVDLMLTEADRAPARPTRLRNAAVEGFKALGDSLIGFAAFALSAGPVLLFWGALAAIPAWYAWRRFRR